MNVIQSVSLKFKLAEESRILSRLFDRLRSTQGNGGQPLMSTKAPDSNALTIGSLNLAMTTATAGTTPCKYIFYLRMSQLCKSVQYACRSKYLLRLNIHRQRSIPKRSYQKLVIVVCVLQNT